jgi:hypothetical protein
MFQFLASFARLRRSDTSLFLVAALLALWAMPLAGQNTFAPGVQSYEAVLLLLCAETNTPQTLHLGAPLPLEAKSKDETPLLSQATAHCGAFRPASSLATPQTIRARRTHDLSATVIARLSGVQTNVRLN